MISLLSAIISIMIPLLLGFMLVSVLWPPRIPFKLQFLLKFFLASGLGLGITSCIFFLWLLLPPYFAGNFTGFIMIEILITVCAVIACLSYRKKLNSPQLPDGHKSFQFQKLDTIIYGASFIALTSSIIVFMHFSLYEPFGGWDAWAIWNLKARFIARGTIYWKEIFSSALSLSHPDYPLLIPLSIARCWKYIGSEGPIIPVSIAAIFTFSTAGLVFSSLSVLRNKFQGFLGALTVLSSYSFIVSGTSQYADIPVGFFILASLVIFAVYDGADRKNFKLLILGGITAGFAAWTKNEGLLFVLLVIVIRFMASILLNGWNRALKESAFFLMGLLPVLLAVFYLKMNLAPPTDLFSSNKAIQAIQSSQSMPERLADPRRYFMIIKAMSDAIMRSGNFAIPMVPFLIFYLLLAGVKASKPLILTAFTSFIILILMLAGYFFTYLITPYDLGWHLGTSSNRLILHLWPGFVFLVFLVARGGEADKNAL